ncbi:caspase-6-like isoform X2 [Labeo rohita]|uniref:Caspase-6 n=1 Tax=Labeo rohita TaxID=84645 RepID=A0A498NPC7_LABRO|nr:caspase-6-like isoform X2 [Labeo rohita]
MASQVKSDESGTVEKDSAAAGQTVRENMTETDSYNRSVFSPDPDEEYKMNHKKRGMALIFNHDHFYWQLRLNIRSGTEADKQNLVGSHGENGHVYAYDGQIEIKEITDLFKGDKCRSLVGKPKIFILQACRGDKHDDPVTPMDAVDSQMDNEVVVDVGSLCTLPAGADFIMCYSVAEGYYSHRETVRGSWYIQDLCEVLGRYGSTLEFTDILTLVNRKVAYRSVENSKDRSAIGKKQVPCFASMLTKKLFFKPKKGH